MDAIANFFRALDLQAMVLLSILLVAARAFSRMVNDTRNNVQASDFYSSKGSDGKEHGDTSKLAKLVGVFASTLMVAYTFWAHKIESFWPVSVFLIWLIFISGIDVFSAWARSFVDRRYGTHTPPEVPTATREQSTVTIDKLTTQEPPK
jgi:hypothetical protein